MQEAVKRLSFVNSSRKPVAISKAPNSFFRSSVWILGRSHAAAAAVMQAARMAGSSFRISWVPCFLRSTVETAAPGRKNRRLISAACWGS